MVKNLIEYTMLPAFRRLLKLTRSQKLLDKEALALLHLSVLIWRQGALSQPSLKSRWCQMVGKLGWLKMFG